MEKRTINCEKCGNTIEFTLYSQTLSQIVKCSSCFSRFSYDPSKQDEPEKQEKKPAAAREQPKAPAQKKKPEPVKKPLTENEQQLACPDCGKGFKVELPKKKKELGKTICPGCHSKFSFKRKDWVAPAPPQEEAPAPPPPPAPAPEQEEMEYEEDLPAPPGLPDEEQEEYPEEPKAPEEPVPLPPPPPPPPLEQKAREGKQQVSCPDCDFSFEVVLPLVKKKEVLTACPLCQHEFSFQRADYFFSDETFEKPEKKAIPPPPKEMEYGGEDQPVPDTGKKVLPPFLDKYVTRTKNIGLAFLDFDLHSVKESLLPANIREQSKKKSGIAAMLLLVVFILGISNAFVTLAFGLGQDADDTPDNAVTVAGTVYYKDEGVVEGAYVELVGTDREYTTTAEGKYWLHDVKPGEITIKVTHEDYGTAIVKAEIEDRKGELPPEFDVMLPDKGEETKKDLTNGSGDGMKVNTVFFLSFLVFLFASLFALLGAISCLLSRNFKTAKYGAFVGVLSFGFLIGSILAFAAVLLILVSKKEFEKKRFSDVANGD